MRTLVLPITTRPRLVGGTWNVPVVGICGGMFCAIEPTVAAGLPLIRTFTLVFIVILPLNGNGCGVGTGPPGLGTSTTWMSAALTMVSPNLAAPCPMMVPVSSVHVDHRGREL